jgi:hypothetical protein
MMTTNYAKDMIVNVSNDGMTDELWQLVNDDSKLLSKINVSDDKRRNLYFYLDNFYDDLLKEFNYSIDTNKEEILQNAFNKLYNKEKVDLTDIRKAIYKSLKQRKVAYPNIKGTQSGNEKSERDIMKWVQALGHIRKAKDKEKASKHIMEGWSPMEKLDFSVWMRYYENGDHEKYKTAAAILSPDMEEVPLKTKEIEPPIKKDLEKPIKVKKTLEESKRSLISRLDSASRLLREFANVWPENVWGRLAQALSDLKREIIPLKTIATANDKVIKTANIWEKEGFSEGAKMLRKIAAPEREDLASKIDKALSGREYDIKGESAGGEGDIPGMEDMLGGMGEMPPAGEEAPLEGQEGMDLPPAGAEESLPPAEAPPAEAPPIEEPKIDDTDPFAGKSVQDVLDILEPIQKKISERELVRNLSKADMILDSLNIASHFPELGEVQAKTLELNLYVGTRLDKIINKLKGGVKDEKAAAPEVDMGEFSEEPGKEKEMFEVTEEPAAPPVEKPAGV